MANSSKLTKSIIFKEESELIHKDKIDKMLIQSENVVRKFIHYQWPEVWPKLQANFNSQSEFSRERKHFQDKNINSIEPDHLDLSVLLKLLQNGAQSPVCGNKNPPPKLKGLYEKAWTNPKEDLKAKVDGLKVELRKNNAKNSGGKSSTDDEDETSKSDIQEIMRLSKSQDFLVNVSSYLWLLNKMENRPQEAILDAPSTKYGIDGCLAVLKLSNPTLNTVEYSFVSTVSLLRVLRNEYTHDFQNRAKIPKAAFDKDFKIIQKSIQNLLYLMGMRISDETLNDVERFRLDVENDIEKIYNSTSYETEIVYLQVTEASEGSDINRLGTTNSGSVSSNLSIQNTTFSNNSTEAAFGQEAKEYFCNVCSKQLNNASQYNDHINGKPHQKKKTQITAISPLSSPLAANNWTTETDSNDFKSELSINNNFYLSMSDEQQKAAVKSVMYEFVSSFNPLPAHCVLRGIGIFTPSDVEMIRALPDREERVVEFLSILQNKNDWFRHLINILEKSNYSDLLKGLQNAAAAVMKQ